MRKTLLLLFCGIFALSAYAQVSKTISVATPGTLSSLLTSGEKSTITSLTVTGTIDVRDFKTIRDQLPALSTLNIKEVSIAAYSGNDGTGSIANYPANAIPNSAFYQKKGLSSIVLPESATTIQAWSFFSNTGLTSITIPQSVTLIGENAFQDCSKLATLIISDASAAIGDGAFFRCSLLADVSLGKNVISIGNSSFSNCKALVSMTIPVSVKSLGSFAFSVCTALKTVDIQGAVTELPDYAFDYCTGLTSVTFPPTLITINQLAFRDCWMLDNVVFPNSLKTIKTNAFSNCKSITSLDIPASVTTIESGVFYGNTSLKTLTLPWSVSNLDMSTFRNCTALELITVNSYQPIPTVSSNPNFPYGVFDNVDKTKCVLQVPYKSKKFYQVASEWKNFQNITEKETGVSPEVQKLYISPDEGTMGEIRLSANCSWTVGPDKSWLSVSPASGVNDGKIAFTAAKNDSVGARNANILLTDADGIPQKIAIVQSGKLLRIDNTAGELTRKLTKAEKLVVGNIKLTGTMDARDFKLMRDSLPALNSLDLSEVKISAYAGNDGTSQEYNYNYAADEIPEYALYTNIGGMGKSSLASVKLPFKLNTIKKYAFMKCSGLTEIYIPKSVSNIGCEAFDGCTGLKKVIVNNRKPAPLTYCWYSYRVFDRVDTTGCKLIIPYNTKPLYAAADQWKEFRNVEEYPYYLFPGTDTLRLTSKTGNTVSVAVQSNVSWTAVSDQSWITFKSVSGANNDSLVIVAEPNPDLTPRTAIVRLKTSELEPEILVVTQNGFEVNVSLTPGTLKTAVSSTLKKNLTTLALTGSMDARDFRILRDSMPNLTNLDLSKVKIVLYRGTAGTGQETYLATTYPAGEIPEFAFKIYDSWSDSKVVLKNIILPDSLVSVGKFAFSDCATLRNFEFPPFVTTLKDYAFESCYGLTSLKIPGTIKTFGSGVFYDCDGMTSVQFQQGAAATGTGMFENCYRLAEVTLPETLVTIGDATFKSCPNLAEVILPAKVKNIGNSAFYSCSKLARINIPDSVATVGNAVFYQCTELTGMAFPQGVKTLGNDCFNGCTKLASVQLPDSLIAIGNNCFEKCSSLTAISLPSGLNSIGSSAFTYSGIKSIDIPDGVTVIRPSTFGGCYSLTSVKLPKTITAIQWFAFNDCAYLPAITIPNSVTAIGDCAFQGCKSLTSIVCKTTLPVIFSYDDWVFNNVNKTSCVLYVNYKTKSAYLSAMEWKDFKNIVESSEGVFVETDKVYLEAAGEEPKTLPVTANVQWDIINKTDWIKAVKGSGNGSEAVVISATDNNTFVKRSGYIELSDTNGETYKITVNQDAALKVVDCTVNTLNTKLTIPEKRQLLYLKITGTIDARDFKIIRDSLTSIQRLDISEAIIAEYRGFVELDPDRWGMGYTYYAATIPASAFYSKGTLKEVVLPVRAKKIEKRSFMQCDNLKSVVVPDSVTAIDYYAFYACDSLKSVTLGKEVKAIGSDCFAYCYALSSITVNNPVPVTLSASGYVFDGVSRTTCSLHVPNGSLDAYKAAAVWKEFLNISENFTAAADNRLPEFSVWPNPVANELYIRGLAGPSLLTVYDLNGKNVMQTQTDDNAPVSVAHLKSGVYLLRIQNSSGTATRKFIRK